MVRKLHISMYNKSAAVHPQALHFNGPLESCEISHANEDWQFLLTSRLTAGSFTYSTAFAVWSCWIRRRYEWFMTFHVVRIPVDKNASLSLFELIGGLDFLSLSLLDLYIWFRVVGAQAWNVYMYMCIYIYIYSKRLFLIKGASRKAATVDVQTISGPRGQTTFGKPLSPKKKITDTAYSRLDSHQPGEETIWGLV